MSEALNISVHPLVVMNLSDHLTRSRFRSATGKKTTRVVGLLLGRQDGRSLEIVNSIEINYEMKGNEVAINLKFAAERVEQYKIMYKDLDCIGWYSGTGAVKAPQPGMDKADEPTADDLRVTKTIISQLCENPLLLMLNPHSKAALEKKKIPFFLYEAAVME